jgi:hypothetical protein
VQGETPKRLRVQAKEAVKHDRLGEETVGKESKRMIA